MMVLAIAKHLLDKRKTAYNTGFASGGVSCKLGALCFYSSVVLADSFVLRNPPERKARNRYVQFQIRDGILDAVLDEKAKEKNRKKIPEKKGFCYNGIKLTKRKFGLKSLRLTS